MMKRYEKTGEPLKLSRVEITAQSPSHSPTAPAVAGGTDTIVELPMFADEAQALARFLDRIALHSVMEVLPEVQANHVLAVAIRMRGFL